MAGSEDFTDLTSADKTVMSSGEIGVSGVVGESWTGGSSSLGVIPSAYTGRESRNKFERMVCSLLAVTRGVHGSMPGEGLRG